MTNTNILLFYVTDPQVSRRFYADLLGLEPVEESPTFVLFMLPSGLALGLWGAGGVQPAPIATGVRQRTRFQGEQQCGGRRHPCRLAGQGSGDRP